jgi:FkbM family methyltransferase
MQNSPVVPENPAVIGYLRRFARAIRHAPGLRRAQWLWNALRPGYHRVLNTLGGGVPLRFGPLAVRIPAEFSGLGWEGYEPEAVNAFVAWIKDHPACTVLDVGCSVGLMSLLALASSDAAEVWAFDADLTSLGLIERLCKHTRNPSRVRPILGLLSADPTDLADIETAVFRTAEELQRASRSPDLHNIRYVCLDGANEKVLPVYSLDRLLAHVPSSRPALLKIDVEGAELLVLQGAERLVREWQPTMLVSVHPVQIQQYNLTADDVRQWLTNRGYGIEILAIDHEEHWWCTPENNSRAR